MNKKINSIAKQAGLTYGADKYYFSPTSFGVLERDLEKFATLIIQDYIEYPKTKRKWQWNTDAWSKKTFTQRMKYYMGIKK